MFPDEPQTAFANNIAFWVLGNAIGFGYSSVLCTNIKLYIIFTMLWIGVAGYFVAEYMHRKQQKRVHVFDNEGQVIDVQAEVSQNKAGEAGVESEIIQNKAEAKEVKTEVT